MARATKVTGADFAFVNVKREAPNNVVQIHEGEDLPKDLAAGEYERLEALGVFDEHPRVAKQRAQDAAIRIGDMFVIPEHERSSEEVHANDAGTDDDEVGEHLGEIK